MRKKYFVVCSIVTMLGLASCDYSRFDFNQNTQQTSKTQERDSIYQIATSNQIIEVHYENNSIIPTNIEEAVERVYDSVVVINAYKSNGYSAGSGVLFATGEGVTYVITCHHVIDGASTFEVTLSNQEVYPAALIGGDATTDIAVLAIEKTGLDVVSFTQDSSTIKVGSTAIVIGNPLGILANSVTSGIISAKSREIKTSDGTMHTLIQTDAAINSGNSGGGLFNVAGELVGIVSSKYSASGVEGLGFAVPANIARAISTELCEHGYIEGRYDLGITITDGTYSVGGFFGSRYNVTYISAVEADGSCYNLLKKDDILTGIRVNYKDSEKQSKELTNINSASAANDFLSEANLSIGDKIVFIIKRNGYNSQETEVEVEIAQYIYRVN